MPRVSGILGQLPGIQDPQVAFTRHGATIGIYVPTKPKPSQAELEALRLAGEKMRELIAAAGTTEDELVEDFKRLRCERRMQKR
jgi:hypothetical protein